MIYGFLTVILYLEVEHSSVTGLTFWRLRHLNRVVYCVARVNEVLVYSRMETEADEGQFVQTAAFNLYDMSVNSHHLNLLGRLYTDRRSCG